MSRKMSSKEMVIELLWQANAELPSDRRSEPRIPFFRAVSICVDDHCYSGFIRDISHSSVGMLHNMELPRKEVEITVDGQRDGFRVRIERCNPCGEGWFVSGGRVVDSDD